MGIIVYVRNKPFVSDFNALQLELARILQMSLSNPTTGGLSPPTIWQPPLPNFAPPPLPTSASIPTTPALTQPTTQYLYDDPNDPYQQFPVRRINYDSSFLTPTSTRPLDPSIVYGTPPHHQAQHMPRTPGFQPFFSGYPAVTSFGAYSRSVTKSPSEYIRAGIPVNRGTIMPPSASAYPLSCDEFGQQYPSLQAAAAARGRDLHSIFTAYGMNYPYVPVDRDLTEFPLLLTNPITTSATEKLHHQTERILKYFQRAAQHRDGTFRLDHLGELAYQDGRCELYHQHAARLLEALRAVDLLKGVFHEEVDLTGGHGCRTVSLSASDPRAPARYAHRSAGECITASPGTPGRNKAEPDVIRKGHLLAIGTTVVLPQVCNLTALTRPVKGAWRGYDVASTHRT